MKRSTKLLILALTLWAFGATARAERPQQTTYKDEVRAGPEEIYVARTARTQHKPGATPACASAPFASANEDYYELWSLEVRAKDSRVVDTHKSAVGGFTACLGQLVAGHPVPMYATGTVARIPWIGVGECTVVKSQPPVKTVIAFHCLLDLSGLPDAYTGGFLVSSTLSPFISRDQPATAHVPGYLSTSMITMRLWRKPAAK